MNSHRCWIGIAGQTLIQACWARIWFEIQLISLFHYPLVWGLHNIFAFSWSEIVSPESLGMAFCTNSRLVVRVPFSVTNDIPPRGESKLIVWKEGLGKWKYIYTVFISCGRWKKDETGRRMKEERGAKVQSNFSHFVCSLERFIGVAVNLIKARLASSCE